MSHYGLRHSKSRTSRFWSTSLTRRARALRSRKEMKIRNTLPLCLILPLISLVGKEPESSTSLDSRIALLEERVAALEAIVKANPLELAMRNALSRQEPDLVEVKSEKEILEKNQEREATKYISDYMDLYDVESKYYDSYLHDSRPGVTFKIRNRGSRTLAKIEVTVYFMDRNGVVISEEDYFPVLEGSFSSDSKPLRPNYIWQMERGKFYQAPNVPSEWKEGAVDAKITAIEFQDDD